MQAGAIEKPRIGIGPARAAKGVENGFRLSRLTCLKITDGPGNQVSRIGLHAPAALLPAEGEAAVHETGSIVKPVAYAGAGGIRPGEKA